MVGPGPWPPNECTEPSAAIRRSSPLRMKRLSKWASSRIGITLLRYRNLKRRRWRWERNGQGGERILLLGDVDDRYLRSYGAFTLLTCGLARTTTLYRVTHETPSEGATRIILLRTRGINKLLKPGLYFTTIWPCMNGCRPQT